MKKRLLALIMTLVMTCTLLPVSAIAEEPTGSTEEPVEETGTPPAVPEEEPAKPEEDPEEEETAALLNQVSMQAEPPFLTLTIQEKDGDPLRDENGEPYQIQLSKNQVFSTRTFPYTGATISQAKIWISGFNGSNAAGWHPIVYFEADVKGNAKNVTILVNSVTITNKDMSNARTDGNTDYVSIDEYNGQKIKDLQSGLKKPVTVVGVQSMPQQPTPQFDPDKLTISLTGSDSPVVLGNGTFQTITVTNTDTVHGKSIKVMDTLPEGLTYSNNSSKIQLTDDKTAKKITPIKEGQTLTWEIPELPAGSTATITLMVEGVKIGSFTSTASIVGDKTDQISNATIEVIPRKLTYFKDFGLQARYHCTGSHPDKSYSVTSCVIGDMEKNSSGEFYCTMTIDGASLLDSYNGDTYTNHTLNEATQSVRLKFNSDTNKWEVNDPADGIVCFTVTPVRSEQTPEKATNQTVYLGADGLIGQQYSNIYYGRYQQKLLAKGENVEKPAGYDDEDLYYDNALASTQKWTDGIVPAYYLIQPVKWRLLSNEDGTLFLLSDQVLDTGCYNKSHMNEETKTNKHPNPHSTTWKTSRLRAFLNNEKGTWCIGGGTLNDNDTSKNLIDLDYTQNGFLKNAFSTGEQDAIAQTELTEDVDSSISSESKVFVLSEEDTTWRGGYGFTSLESTMTSPTDYVLDGGYMTQEWTSGSENYRFYSPDAWPWWTRTHGEYSFRVKYSGSLSTRRETTAQEWLSAIRPAFNIDKTKVLMATPADEAKTTAVSSVLAGTMAAGDPGNDWRLTILDVETFGSFDAQLHDKEKTNVVAGADVTIDFTGAQSGVDEYVSAVIADTDGNALYYGHISKGKTEGTVNVTLPAELEPDEYRLLIFNEYCNEAYNTDFGSNFFEFTLTVRQGEHFPVTYDANGGENAPAGQVKIEDVSLTLSTERPTLDGYSFAGWNTAADGSGTSYASGAVYTDNASLYLYAVWSKESTPEEPTRDDGTLIINKTDANDGSKLTGAYFTVYKQSGSKWVEECTIRTTNGYASTGLDNGKYYVVETMAPAGYTLDEAEHSFTISNNTVTLELTNDKTATPAALNDSDHFAYIIGYEDGTVQPSGNITRAEVATIFFRLLTDEVRDEYMSTSNPFSDVKSTAWYNRAVSTLYQLDILKGSNDGNFHPQDTITRAEFAAIAARFSDKKVSASTPFTDLAGHWAKDEVTAAASLGWVNGYTDGTFRPNQPITRAEAMTLVNRVLNRSPKSVDDLLDDMVKWPDNMDTAKWYYLAVQEATNSHDYKASGSSESWTKLTKAPDWAALEH